MNKNKTPTQLMIEAAALRNERDRPAQRQPGIEELAVLVAETLLAHIPAGAESELSTWLRTREGAQALRESWLKAVQAYLTRRAPGTDLTG